MLKPFFLTHFFLDMKILFGFALGLALLGQSGCGRAADPESKRTAAQLYSIEAPSAAPPALQAEEVSGSAAEAPEQAPSTAMTAGGNPPAPAAPPQPTGPARLLIYHAEVRLKTTAMPRATRRLDSLVRRSGGYLSAANETHADGEWRQETTIRVPPQQFEALLSGLAGLGSIEEKKLSTNDVTAEHADVAARLLAKRAVERQYTTLLTKAQRIKDILAIEEKLGEAREEIEATESRLKTLNSEVAYATITLTLYQPVSQSIPDAPIVSLGSRVVEAFYGGWQLLTSLLVGLVNLWPLLLLGAGAGWLWQRRRQVAFATRAPAAENAA